MAYKKNRAERGSGLFRTTKSGSIEYRFNYTDEFGLTKRKSVSGKTEEECMEKVELFLADQAKICLGIRIHATILEILEYKYKQDYELNYAGIQGYHRNLESLKIIERSILATIPIADVTKEHLHYYLSTITRYSNSVIEKCYNQLKTAFSIAKEEGIIEKNLMTDRRIRRPKSDKIDKKVRGYTPNEQDKIVEALAKHKVPYGRNSYKNQLLIELYTGLRMGEINALKPDDIDMDGNIIHVRRTISQGYKSEPFISDTTKTYAGMRDVPMSKDAKAVIMKSLEEMRHNPEGLIFYDYNKDRVIRTNLVNCFFKRVCEKNALMFNGQHALRHTFATRCIEANIQPIVLKNWLGHTDIHVTLDTYADVFDGLNNKSINMLDEYSKAM